MSHFRRRLMMQRKASILPAGYTQLEYIERDADNRGYIDTGLIMKLSYQMILDFMPVQQLGAYQGFWGSHLFSFICSKSNTFYLYFFKTQPIEVYSTEAFFGAWNEVTYNSSLYLNGNKFVKKGTSDDSVPMLLLTTSKYMNYTSYTKVSYFKVSDGNNVLMELIPARRNSDSVVGMYDLVSNNFLTSPSGTIKAGPKV